MVQAPKKNWDLLVKLSLSIEGKSPIAKRVFASDYATLLDQAKKLGAKHDIKDADWLRYNDGQDWIIIEDDMDLDFAYDFAATKCKKQTSSIMPASNGQTAQITFSIKPHGVAAASSRSTAATLVNQEDEDMKDEAQPAIGHAKGKKDKVKGIPRKALKALIAKELEAQSKGVFTKLLQSDDLPAAEQSASEAEAVHHGVACDGCGVNPIVGIRYKCSVNKNFDYCAKCEERLDHPYAFLKITRPGGAPEVMITMMNEEQEKAAAQEESKGGCDPSNFVQEMIDTFAPRGGHAGRGGRGCGRGGRGGGFRNMIDQFMNKFDNDDIKQKFEEFQKQWAADKHCGGAKDWNFNGKKDWKEARAVCTRKPENVIVMAPGSAEVIEIDVLNDTYWPWKYGCTLTLADEQPDTEIPIEVFQVPIEQEVKGKASATFQVPLTMAPHIVADSNKVYTVMLTFRGPRGQPYGQLIPIKIKCEIKDTSIAVYQLAIKLHEQLQLGSLDDCISAVRACNCDEAESIKTLQRKQ